MPIPGPGASSGATLKFVDSIAASPATRLDLNDQSIWLLEVGSDFSPPGLKESFADTILNDGALPSASAYTNRRLGLRLSLVAATEDVKATQLRLLHVELNRESNILMYQPGSTPLFFRTFRSPGYRLTETETPAYTTVDLDIEAEPFAYGLQVTQAGVSVKTNPALTNGCYLDVNTVTGDVETPAYVALSAGTYSTTGDTYIAVRRRGTPANLGFVLQAESAASTAYLADVFGASADAAASGGNVRNINFSTTTNLAPRIAWKPSEGVEIKGTYRALVRLKKSASGDTIRVGVGNRNDLSLNSYGTTVSGTSYQIVDAGLVQIPIPQIQTGYTGTTPDVDTASNHVWLYVGRASGAGTVSIDYMLLLPADEDLAVLGQGSISWTSASSRSTVLDGPNDTAYCLTSGGAVEGGFGAIPRAGSFPVLRPGNNRLFFVENVNAVGLTDSTTVTVSFWPRYLVV